MNYSEKLMTDIILDGPLYTSPDMVYQRLVDEMNIIPQHRNICLEIIERIFSEEQNNGRVMVDGTKWRL